MYSSWFQNTEKILCLQLEFRTQRGTGPSLGGLGVVLSEPLGEEGICLQGAVFKAVGSKSHTLCGFCAPCGWEASEAWEKTALLSSAVVSLHLEFSAFGFPGVLQLALSGELPAQRRVRVLQLCLGRRAKAWPMEDRPRAQQTSDSNLHGATGVRGRGLSPTRALSKAGNGAFAREHVSCLWRNANRGKIFWKNPSTASWDCVNLRSLPLKKPWALSLGRGELREGPSLPAASKPPAPAGHS